MSSKIRSFSASLPPKGQKQGHGDANVTWIQQSLKTLGYDPGPVDGIMGAKTIAAIKKFQQNTPDPGTLGPMKADGIVGPRTKAALEHGLGGSQPQPGQQDQPQTQPKKGSPSTSKSVTDHAKEAGNEVIDHAKDDANQVVDHAKDDANQVLDHGKDDANQVLDHGKDDSNKLLDHAGDAAQDIEDHAEKAAENYLDKKKKAAEDWIDNLTN